MMTTFDKRAYIDRLKTAGFAEPQVRAMADGLDQALREDATAKRDAAALKSEFNNTRDELLAAMKANKISFLKWFATLIAAQTAFLAAMKFLAL